jgi:gliding motility-associated-like protein
MNQAPSRLFQFFLLLFFVNFSSAQNFSLNCTRDTVIPGCPANICFTLKGRIPDIRKETSSYTINPTSTTPGCFPVYVTPNDPGGTSTNLTIDDRYSSLITIGFPFSFYGTLYNTLAASTNGYLTFDASRAGLSAAWSIPSDLPSASYDRAVIMGPNHDLFPSASQPNQRIQYQVYGTAPHRRWVLSFNEVRLFSCTNLDQNTHQIVLYESLNVIEVLVFSKQTCTGWNNGRAVIGIQDWDRTMGMMAPRRSALGPTWGGLNMNESWRFAPNGGPSLLKRVELLDNNGTIIETILPAAVTNLGNGNLEVAFPNICPPGGSVTNYVIRSVFEKFDDPTIEISTSDTVRVNRSNGLSATSSSTPTACGNNNGSISITNLSGGTTPYQFSINGGTSWQASNTFSGLAAGSYTVTVKDATGLCTTALSVVVSSAGSPTANFNSISTSCLGATNGTLTVTPSSGTPPFQFSIDGGAFVSGNAPFTFTGLSSGNHTVLIKDATGCVSNASIIAVSSGPALTTTATSTPVLCNGTSTGLLTVAIPFNGTPPYQYSLDGLSWHSSNQFSGLSAGTYNIRFRESNGCQGSTSVVVTEPSTITSTTNTIPVICNGQANGTLTVTATGGTAPYQFSVDGVNWQSATAFNLAAGAYTISIKDANSCLTTSSVTITEPAALAATITTTNATCNGGNDGRLTITAAGGNGGFGYSIDGGVNWQSSGTYSVAPGIYQIRVRDALNCTYTGTATVGLTNDLTFTPHADPTICESRSTQLNVLSNGLQFDWTPATGLSAVNISNPIASPLTTTQYVVKITLGRCITSDTVVVRVNAAPIPEAGADRVICFGQSLVLQGSGGTAYQWTPPTYLNNASFPNATSTPDRDIFYVLSILSDANGCAGLTTDTVKIHVTPPIQVLTYPSDTIGYPGDQFTILAVANDPDVTFYSWTPSVGLSNTLVSDPMVTIGAIGSDVRYKVVASTMAGCKGEAFVNVRVYKGPDIYVSTGFTPNGDGRNDRFTPFPVGMKSYNYFRVFNRWGQMVFQSKTMNDGWDGTVGGQKQPEGIYIWMIEGITKDGRVITKKGSIMLIK